MMTSIEPETIRMRYFTKSALQDLCKRATAEGRENIIPVNIIEGLQDNICYPIFSNSIQEDMFTAKIALSEDGEHVVATVTPEELEALPTKMVPRPE